MGDEVRAFLAGEAPNIDGKTIWDILDYKNFALEDDHNYIQWVFPTDEKSFHSKTAPIITKGEARLWGQDETIQENMHKMFQKMLIFYGYPSIKSIRRWGYDHNRLRITRIFKSLKMFGLMEEYEELKHWIASHPKRAFDPISYGIWEEIWNEEENA